MTCGVGMYDVALVTTIFSVAVLTIIRIFERKILPSGFKRSCRYKLTVYGNEDVIFKIQEYVTTIVERIDNMSVKKLIDSEEKVKLTIIFEFNRKKVMNKIYHILNKNYVTDALTIQEYND